MPKVIPEYKEQAKKKILETASEVFTSRGYHEATMDDVANEIGVSKGAVYQYFPSKEALFRELCVHNAEELESSLMSVFTDEDALKIAEEHIEEELEGKKTSLIMVEALAHAPTNVALQDVVRENYARYVKIIAKFIEKLKNDGRLAKDTDSLFVARTTVALRHGVIVSALMGLDKTEAKRIWSETLIAILVAFGGYSPTRRPEIRTKRSAHE